MKQALHTRGFIVLTNTLLVLLGLLLAVALLLGGAAAWYWQRLPPLDKVVNYQPRQHLQVFTADGMEIAQFGTERRSFIAISAMPKGLKDAVLSVEDTQFYEHSGISWRGLARAALANATGGMPQGASTITQQVARTFFLSTRRTAERKIKEALLAWQIERRLSKDQIFELYLNQIFLGQRAYGFGAAAQVYFGKPLAQLSVAETAMLAGLPQNPIYANPISNAERARKRQRMVLSRMLAVGVINEAEYSAAVAEKLVLRSPAQVELGGQHVAEMARRMVFERFGEEAYSRGLRVLTSLRVADQRAAQAALRSAVIAHERKQPWRGPEDQEDLPEAGDTERAAAQALKEHRDDEDLRVAIVTDIARAPNGTARELTLQLVNGERVPVAGDTLRWLQNAVSPKATAELALKRGSIVRAMQQTRGKLTEWVVVQWPQAEGAFVAMDPATGRVRALVGGFSNDGQQFNRVTSAWRQPGSSFKPFLYSAAFESGVMPETLVNDAPLLAPDGSTPSWNPQNSDGRFDGPISVREGLVRSKNLVSVRLLQQVGLAPARGWIGQFGFDAAKQPDNLTLALGAGSTTPLQMAGAYAMLANGGHRVAPVIIERIVDAHGVTLFEAPPPEGASELTRALPARNVFLVNSLLNDVTLRGTAARAQAALKRSDLFGKTGTTNDAVDAWFAGFHRSLVAVAWLGFDEPKSLGERESGGGLALPMWIDYMRVALKGVPLQPLGVPPGLVTGASDYRYAEWADGGFIEHIGLEPLGAAPANGEASQPER
jgi:penicillin-binding protein 1A